MLVEKVFEILKDRNKKQEVSVSNSGKKEEYSSAFETNSESGCKSDKSKTSQLQKESYSSQFESGTDESKQDDTVESGGPPSEHQKDTYSSHFESGTDESKPDDVSHAEIPESGESAQSLPDQNRTNAIKDSNIPNISNELSEPDDPASESQSSDNIPETAAPVPEPPPLAPGCGWNPLSTIEEVTTVADTQTGLEEDQTADFTESGQEDITHSYYSRSDDTFKQSQNHSEVMSDDEIQSLSVDNKTMNLSSNQEEGSVHDNDEGLQNTNNEIESLRIPTPTVISESLIANDIDASAHSLDVSSDISDSEENKQGPSKTSKVEVDSHPKEKQINSEIESLQVAQHIEKETTDILEDIIKNAVRISEIASNGERSLTPDEFIALSVHETDDESVREDNTNPVSAELTPKSHPDPAEEEQQPEAPSVTVDDTSTEAVRLSEGEVLVAGLISEGELSLSDGGSLVTQSVTGLSGNLGDSDSEPGEASRGQLRRRLPVSLDTSSSSSWSEGEWRASPARMRRFLNMASAFRMINKSDQE